MVLCVPRDPTGSQSLRDPDSVSRAVLRKRDSLISWHLELASDLKVLRSAARRTAHPKCVMSPRGHVLPRLSTPWEPSAKLPCTPSSAG